MGSCSMRTWRAGDGLGASSGLPDGDAHGAGECIVSKVVEGLGRIWRVDEGGGTGSGEMEK